MDAILISIDAFLGVITAALSLSAEIVRARRCNPAQQQARPDAYVQSPEQGEAV
ncbi:hypothetical protein QMK28_30910 [Streptomyces sp. H27-D2]|nr:hypothetical protein [Streptomyces sp. H27-D2]